MVLNTLLAGPILRRTEAERAFIWVATSRPASVVAEVFSAKQGDPSDLERIGGGAAESIRLGENLYVHLVCARPSGETWPLDQLLAYDLRIVTHDDDPVLRLADLGLLDGVNKITYGDWPLPTFFVPSGEPALKVIHGSCRLLHGRGDDALAAADDLLGAAPDDLQERPQGLFLTGDQIYADDVASPLIGHVRALATELMGPADDVSVPGVGPLSDVGVGSREEIACGKARFTSAHCDNHLMSFGEFAAMYLCAWSHENWPSSLPAPAEGRGSQSGANAFRSQRTWAGQVRALELARVALPAVRRLFANVPVYMIFDDHDVTDDWNLTQEWADDVRASPTGRRVVANALGTFWAFQGWGNDPDGYDDRFKTTVEQHAEALGDPAGGPAEAFDALMWTWNRWSFYAPTRPPLVCTDTRTQRSFDSPDGAARLIGKNGLSRLVDLTRSSGHEPGEPLLLVSPVPVFGFELQERRQKYLLDKVGPYEIDFEAWHSNLRGFVDFMQVLIDELQPSFIVLMSGDVHYGVNARAAFRLRDRELPIIQLVSSGQKHAGVIATAGINALGRILRRRHERLGWEDLPSVGRFEWLRDRIFNRPVNTDEWSGVSPMFVAPRDARALSITEPPEYRECREYVRPEEHGASLLMGLNNVGYVTLKDGRVEHRLLGRNGDETKIRTAVIDARSGSLFD
ncbi:MAG: hypothetical protein M3198_12450 [Actinomycetota bacterium]|nr:hypothetical protein [Actinomycetota bacterium]